MSKLTKALSKRLVPAFIREDYTPYDCKVSAIKENYNMKGRMIHAQNIIKTIINTKRIPLRTPIQCKECLFNTRIPNIYITHEGICNMCHAYKKNFDLSALQEELKDFLAKKREPGAQYDAVVAYSGGKDSTVSLSIAVQDYHLKVLAVLVDNGFIPQEVIDNSTEICSKLGVPFKVVKFDFIPKLKELKKDNFAKGYPCNVCTIIFHDVITKVCVDERVNRVILGRNWWRLLDPKVKAIRIVQPPGVDFSIEFMSLPFALQMKEEDQQKYLQRVGWIRKNIYGDSTNCLIPGLVEKTVYDRIGYHPELNLLSREVITGFIKKEKAASQLSTVKDLSEQLNSILDKKDTTGK